MGPSCDGELGALTLEEELGFFQNDPSLNVDFDEAGWGDITYSGVNIQERKNLKKNTYTHALDLTRDKYNIENYFTIPSCQAWC